MRNIYFSKIFTLYILFVLGNIIASAQDIQGNKLISWASAAGNIRIPDEVTEIVENCFYTPADPDGGWGAGEAESNTNITSVDFNNVKIVGKSAFRGCIGIVSILSPQIETIAEDAFKGCISLKKLDLPSIINLDKDVFADCSDLEKVAIGRTLAVVGENPFRNCPKLSNLSMSSGQGAYFSTEGNALIRVADGMLVSVGGAVTELVIGNNCKQIGVSAMFGCSRLTKVDLFDVKKIGDKALTNCSSLVELLLPKLESVDNSSFITMNGVGNLKVVDIHLSPDFKGFNNALADNANTTVYVANAKIKATLRKELKKTNIAIGAPSEVQKFKISYSCSQGGSLDVWTKGAINVVSGQSLSAGSTVNFKAIPLFDYEVESWTFNGTNITSSVQNNIYIIEAVKENIDVEVKFRKKAKGHYIFFKSLASTFGSLSCVTSDGMEIKSGDRVPVNSILTFAAKPVKGFRVTEWKKDKGSGAAINYVVIQGQTGKNTYTCSSEDGLDIVVDFDRIQDNFIVKFGSYNTDNGTLTAALADGTVIVSGEAFPKGSKIVFTVHPIGDNTVDEWQLNGETIAGYKEHTYTIEGLSADVEIGVVCTKNTTPGTAPIIRDGHLISWKPEGAAILPTEVTHIDSEAFAGAVDMTSLKLNNNVRYIGERAFLYATKITHFEVPVENNYFATDHNGVLYNKERTLLVAYPAGRPDKGYEIIATAKSIMPGCFVTCPRLLALTVAKGNTDLNVEKGILYTADGATLLYYPTGVFQGMPTEIRLKEGIKTVSRLALSYHPAIKKLFLPSTLKVIEGRAFSYNPALVAIEFGEGILPQIETIGDSAFYYDRSLAKLPYMPKLRSIGKRALGVTSLLEEIHIPVGCTIGEKAFSGCVNIKKIYAYDTTPAVIESDAFTDIEYINEAVLYVPKGTKAAYSNAVGWSIFGSNIVENDNTTGLEPVIEDNSNLTIRRTHDGFILEGLKAGIRYALYTAEGKVVMQGTIEGNTLIIAARADYKMLILRIEGMKAIKLIQQ